MLVPPCSAPVGLLHVMSEKGLVNTPEIQVWAASQPLTVGRMVHRRGKSLRVSKRCLLS